MTDKETKGTSTIVRAAIMIIGAGLILGGAFVADSFLLAVIGGIFVLLAAFSK